MAIIEIDQSGKWESSAPTVIGVDIDKKREFSSLITAPDKNTARKMLGGLEYERKQSKQRMVIRMFAFTVFLTIKDLVRDGDTIYIDNEYEGNENSIRDLLCHLFRTRLGLGIGQKSIIFTLVGKESLAHKVAHSTFCHLRNPDKKIEPSEYYRLLDKTVEIRRKAFLRRQQRNAKR